MWGANLVRIVNRRTQIGLRCVFNLCKNNEATNGILHQCSWSISQIKFVYRNIPRLVKLIAFEPLPIKHFFDVILSRQPATATTAQAALAKTVLSEFHLHCCTGPSLRVYQNMDGWCWQHFCSLHLTVVCSLCLIMGGNIIDIYYPVIGTTGLCVYLWWKASFIETFIQWMTTSSYAESPFPTCNSLLQLNALSC